MDIATLNAVIKQLSKQVVKCQSMLEWSVEENNEHVMMWSHSLTQAKTALSSVETMLENEIAYREAS